MSTIDDLTQRFHEQTRAIRWLIIAIALVALFLVWDQTLGRVKRAWSASANEVEANVDKVRRSALSDRDEGREQAAAGDEAQEAPASTEAPSESAAEAEETQAQPRRRRRSPKADRDNAEAEDSTKDGAAALAAFPE